MKHHIAAMSLLLLLPWFNIVQVAASDTNPKSSSELFQDLIRNLLIENNDFKFSPRSEDIEVIVDRKKNNLNEDFGTFLAKDVKAFEVNKQTRRFSLTIALNDSDNEEEVTIYGWYKEFVRLPVLKNHMKAGEIIQEKDVKELKLDVTKLRDDTIFDKDKLIGNAARYSLSAEQPIKSSSIASPKVISKGDLVNVVYNHNNLNLKLEGIALESGAVGDTIKIKNPRSNAVLYAIIENKNLARIYAKISN